SRRRFLQGSAVLGAGVAAGPLLGTSYAFATPNDPSAGDVLVVVFLRGGADGLSMVVPWSDDSYQDLRTSGAFDIAVPPPDVADPTNTAIDLGVNVGGHDFGLHPGFGGADGTGGLKGVWDAGHLAVVHATGLTADVAVSRSHFEAQDYWERTSADPNVVDGWIARHLAAVGDGSGIPAVGWGNRLPRLLRPDPTAIAMASIDGFGVAGFTDDTGAAEVLRALHPAGAEDPLRRQGAATLDAVDLVAAEDPGQYDDNVGLYPTEGLGAALGGGLYQIAQLIRADVGLRAAVIDIGGWDLHASLGPVTGGPMRTQVEALSGALTAFHDDLGPLMDEVTVVTHSEFGRTINMNGSGGTDHGRGSCCFVMSGNANQGIWGSYPAGPLADGPEGDLHEEGGTDEVDVVALAETAIDAARHHHPDVAFELEAVPEPAVLTGSAEGLRVLLGNLLDNAATH
ncbi:MAG: DUF1501 domain-containing protein, partial [Actinomycetota bacterium]